MRIIYFDLCAIPLFLMILLICHARKMTKGTANRLFICLRQREGSGVIGLIAC